MQLVSDFIDTVVSKLSGPSEAAWNIMMRQTIANAIGRSIIVVALIILLIAIYFIYKNILKQEVRIDQEIGLLRKKDGGWMAQQDLDRCKDLRSRYETLKLVVFGFGTLSFCIITEMSINTFKMFYNPAYYTIMDIFRMVK